MPAHVHLGVRSCVVRNRTISVNNTWPPLGGQRRCESILPARTRGFTLMELIVVVFIIGISLSFVTISLNQHSDRQVEDAVKRLHQLLRLAAEEAVMQSQEYSLMVTKTGYSFAALSLGGKWENVSDDAMLRQREFPENVRVELRIDQQQVGFEDSETPGQIYILSSGELTPFQLLVKTEDEIAYGIEGNIIGQITYLPPGDNDDDF